MTLLNLYGNLARRKPLACIVVALVALLGRAAMIPRWHIPLPGVHDEFSYLLAADTYASGRLTNPTHPLWEHFETFHVLQQPTYMSKYPPFQGLVMAFGQRIFGEPWIGVWLSVGLMCAAACWMLQGWISLPWALLGGLMVASRIGIVSYWMNSYWGGAVAAAGGALMLGAVPRIVRDRRVRDSLTFAIGGVILMNSRPFEGGVLAALALLTVICWLSVNRLEWRLILPAVLVMAIAIVALAYQNFRVTNNALLLPYVAHDRQYAAASLFVLGKQPAVPTYRHAVLRDYWAVWQAGEIQKSKDDWAGSFFRRIGNLYGFCFDLWPYLAIALIWPFRMKSREERWTVAILAVFLLATLGPLAGTLPHYSAPIVALMYLRLLQVFSHLPEWKIAGKRVGAVVLAATLVAWIGNVGLSLSQPEQAPKVGWERAEILRQLSKTPGEHLVIVRYGPAHSVHDEWVYNRADIDRSHVVWAREMGPAADAPLLKYFANRHVWLLEADNIPPKLEQYPVAARVAVEPVNPLPLVAAQSGRSVEDRGK